MKECTGIIPVEILLSRSHLLVLSGGVLNVASTSQTSGVETHQPDVHFVVEESWF